jgi:hypothetical protein
MKVFAGSFTSKTAGLRFVIEGTTPSFLRPAGSTTSVSQAEKVRTIAASKVKILNVFIFNLFKLFIFLKLKS